VSWALRLTQDRLAADARMTLGAAPRVVWVREGGASIGDGTTAREIAGTLEITVGEEPPRVMQPGGAWFENGRDPVLAKASTEMPTAFIRVSILPREIRGQSSIVYVNPQDASRGRPRRYTVYVDEAIELP